MIDRTFENYVCWKQQKLSTIINVEALSIERPVFLATHIPFNEITYLKSPQNIPDTSEERLLNELLSRAKNDEHTFLVVQGMAGSGKSHLIWWLSERYRATSSLKDSEVVMLIERANSTLRQTLIQITKSNLFDSSRFSEQIERVEKATNQLSDDSLAETLLHWLRIGSNEVTDIVIKMEKVERHRKRVDPYIADFLLNPKVREHLKRKNGPIERLLEYLSSGSRTIELDSENSPVFEAKDFEFTSTELHEINLGGYEATQKLTKQLDSKLDRREYLAKYLNALISYAIQQTTQISVDDLKALFFELRKELKTQGKSLVLLVEDISVFTGLDSGLIDVMVTQHTGGDLQKSLCRMTSVVGVTDAYFKDSFPANIKQRINHHVTLNADATGASKSTILLNNVEEMAKFTCRYLNLLRMPPSDFERWSEEGCEPTELPNACTGCEFREQCHTAFGTVPLDDSNDEREVSLYPFNKSLLNVIKTNLDTTMRSKTPRTLLELIEHLLNYSPAIENGTFPDDKPLKYVKAPRFDHYNYLKTKSKKDADRLERFMMYWGDGSVNEETREGIKYVGGIPTQAYEAFSLQVIDGKGLSTVRSVSSVDTSSEKKPIGTELVQPTPKTIDFRDQVFENIHRWRRGDATLVGHPAIKIIWHKYLKKRIDWDAHHITYRQLEKFRPPQLVIEKQGGKEPGTYLYYQRCDELAEFLEALTQVDKYYAKLPPAKLGHYLLILERWLEANEATVVQFVKTPYKGEEGPPKDDIQLEQVLLENNIYLAMLGGDLQTSQNSRGALIISLVRPPIQFNSIWNQSLALLRQQRGRSETWLDAIKRWGAGTRRVLDQREQFLQMFNRPQGDSRKDAKFIDAPYLLELIDRFNKRKWGIDVSRSIEINKTGHTYQEWLRMYQYFQAHVDTIIAAEKAHIIEMLSALSALIGQHSPAEAFEAIETTLKDLALAGRTYGSFKLLEELTAKKLQIRLNKLNDVKTKEFRKAKMLSYSSVYDTKREFWEYIDYFKEYKKVVDLQLSQVEDELSDTDGSHKVADPGAEVDSDYQELLNALTSVLDVVESVESNEEVLA